MPTRFVQSSTIAAESSTGSHCGVGYNPTDDQFYVNPDGTKRAVMTGRGNARVLTSATALTAADFGKTIFLDLAGGFATTLPAPVLGAKLKFVIKTAPTGSYTVVTSGSSNIIKGQVFTSDVNSATDADFETAGGDTITFVLNKSVAGDKVELDSDGTSWFASAFCSAFDAITITTAS